LDGALNGFINAMLLALAATMACKSIAPCAAEPASVVQAKGSTCGAQLWFRNCD
jgi:hypothetical protein